MGGGRGSGPGPWNVGGNCITINQYVTSIPMGGKGTSVNRDASEKIISKFIKSD